MCTTGDKGRRITAYGIIFLLVLNLLSNVMGGEAVIAHGESAKADVKIFYALEQENALSGEPLENAAMIRADKIYLGYRFEGLDGDAVRYECELTVDESDPVVHTWKKQEGVVEVQGIKGESTQIHTVFRAYNENEDLLADKEVSFVLRDRAPQVKGSVLAEVSDRIENVTYCKGKITLQYQMDQDPDYTKLYRKICGEDQQVIREDHISVKGDGCEKIYEEVLDPEQDNISQGKYTVSYCLEKEDGTLQPDMQTLCFVLDQTAPEITVSLDETGKDPEGKKKVAYTIYSDERWFSTTQISVHASRRTIQGEETLPVFSYTPENAQDTRSIYYTEDGEYQVYVTAKDAAGNVTTILVDGTESDKLYTKQFTIDQTAPVLAFDGAEDGKHYKDKVTLSLRYTDLSTHAQQLQASDPHGEQPLYRIIVQKDDNQPAVFVPEWKSVKDHPDQSVAECVFGGKETNENLFGGDGKYTITFEGCDRYGNQTQAITTSLVMDTKEPSIELSKLKVSHDQLEAAPVIREEDGKQVSYLKADARLSFDIYELNYQWAKAYVDVEWNQQDRTEAELHMQQNPDTLSQVFDKEGAYTAKVWAVDAAGNYEGKDETTGEIGDAFIRYFVVDETAPVFKMTGIAGKNSYCKSGTDLVISAVDENQDPDTYQIKVERTDPKGITTTAVYRNEASDWEKKDESTLVRTLHFSTEGNYVVTITGQDKSGNEGVGEDGDVATISFRIDETKPELTVTGIEEGSYYNEGVVIKGILEELNFKDMDARIRVVRELGNEHEDTEEVLSPDSRVYRFERLYKKSGAYTVTITAVDGAGNAADTWSGHFVIDQERPELTIQGIENGAMTKDSVDLQFVAKDYNHDFTRYDITVVRSDADGVLEDVTRQYPKTEWQENGVTATKELSFVEEGTYEIIFEATDMAGNVAEKSSIRFQIDRTAPVISGVVYSDYNGLLKAKYHNIYSNHAILVEFQVKDQVVGVKDEKIYVTIGRERNDLSTMFPAHKALGNTYYVYVPTDLNVAEFDDVITIWAGDALDNERSFVTTNLIYYTGKPLIQMECDRDYTKWTNEDVTFHTTISDQKAGLKEVVYRVNDKVVKKVVFSELTNTYSYDVTAKDTADKVTGYDVSVEVTNHCGTTAVMRKTVYIDKQKPVVSLSGIEKGSHHNTSQTFTTHVKDVSYKNTKTVYVITKTLDGKTVPVSAAAFRSSKYEDSCDRKMLQEGSYKIYAVTTDSAGNRSVSNTLEFVIDKTAPAVSISGTRNGSMNAQAVELEFQCVESFYRTNRVSIEVERELDGKTVTEQIGGFPYVAKKASMRHTFSEDGTYRVRISATDRAGNVAAAQTISFSIDQTKPVIRITGTENYEQWDHPATVRFQVEESYYSGNHVEIQGTRTDLNGNVTEVAMPKFVNEGKQSSLVQRFDQDGIYSFVITSEDEAGNRESKRMHFTIDQTDPEIHGVRKWNGGYYQQFQLADSLEEVFKDLTVVTYHMYMNGIEYDGVTPVEAEGKYTLDVEAVDELGHVSEEVIEFIIDHTAPKVIFDGVKDGETVRESGVVQLSLTNAEDEITDVRMNGVHYGSDIRSLPYSQYGSYQIEVDCIDKAGNGITRSIYFVYQDPMTRVMIMIVIALVLLVTGGCILIMRKRQKGMDNL